MSASASSGSAAAAATAQLSAWAAAVQARAGTVLVGGAAGTLVEVTTNSLEPIPGLGSATHFHVRFDIPHLPCILVPTTVNLQSCVVVCSQWL